MRRRMPRRIDRKVFKRTASSVASANLASVTFRGGTRL